MPQGNRSITEKVTFEVLKDEQWLFKKIKMGKGIQHTRIGTKRRQFRVAKKSRLVEKAHLLQFMPLVGLL